MQRNFFALGAVLAGLGVAAGAFGAHALRGKIPADLLAIYETGVRYQIYHSFGLLFASLACRYWPGRAARIAGWSLLLGSVVFSGTLYALALTGTRWLGAITPIGGVVQLVGWGALAWAAARPPGGGRA
ncbi:MAG TPA: DUF423 domain-containing protein [candidate division Zixibacteria bacterium]|nr:DUF423 domain-containing protein [candidate division Zixibacteria bacterium]